MGAGEGSTIADFVRRPKKELGVHALKFYGNPEHPVRTVAVMSLRETARRLNAGLGCEAWEAMVTDVGAGGGVLRDL